MICFDRIKSERRKYPNCEATVKKVFVKCDACKEEKWIFLTNVRNKVASPYYCYKCHQNPFKEDRPCAGCGMVIPHNPKSSRCRECRNKYGRERRGETRHRRHENKQKAFELKGGKCNICGYVGPSYHFDYHHLDGKYMKMSALWSRNWKKIEKELDKCELLCAFCHRDVDNKQ